MLYYVIFSKLQIEKKTEYKLPSNKAMNNAQKKLKLIAFSALFIPYLRNNWPAFVKIKSPRLLINRNQMNEFE